MAATLDEPIVVRARQCLRVVRVGQRRHLDGLLAGEDRDVDRVAVQQLLAHEAMLRARRAAVGWGGVDADEVLWMQPGPVRVWERAATAGQLPALQVLAEGLRQVRQEHVRRAPRVMYVTIDHALARRRVRPAAPALQLVQVVAAADEGAAGRGAEVPRRWAASAQRRDHDPAPALAASTARCSAPRSQRRSTSARTPRTSGRAGRGSRSSAGRPRGRTAGRGRPGRRELVRPRRTITAGAVTPSARYSPTTRTRPRPPSPRAAAARGCGRPRPRAPGAREPASSAASGRSSSETGSARRPRREPARARTISGTRAAGSRRAILYQSPRSPSISPWSAVKTTTVSSSRPVSPQRAEQLADPLVQVGDARRSSRAGRAGTCSAVTARPSIAGHVAQAQAVRIGLRARDRRRQRAGRSPSRS